MKKFLTASRRRRTSPKQHKFLLKCGQRQSLMITKLMQKRCKLERSICRIVDAAWAKKHVQQSRYSIQIIKFTKSNCYQKLHTKWMQVLPQYCIPLPAVYTYITGSMGTIDPDVVTKFKSTDFWLLKKRLI